MPDTPIDRAQRAREELGEAFERSRREELDELHGAFRRPARHRSLLVAWARQWINRRARPVAEPLPTVHTGEVGLTYIGHSSLVVRYQRLVVVCDPMLGGRLHGIRRAVTPGLTAAELSDVGLILISSAEPDHLHVPTLAKLPRTATIAVPSRCAELVSRLGFARVIELGVDQTLAHRGVEIASLPVRPGTRAGRGACAWMLRGDGPSVYFCGASSYGAHFADAGRAWRPDLAALPISGYAPRALRNENMSPLDALYAFEDLGARLLVPIRWGTFLLSYERLDEPLRWLTELVEDRNLVDNVAVLRHGASRKFVVNP